MEVTFTLYNGFLIVEYSETDVRAYRSREYYAGNIASYVASSQALIGQVVDETEDQGDFTDAGYYALMQQLGRVPGVEPTLAIAKYPDHIMERVRQRLALEEWDTSRDEEINNMTHNEVFGHCLEWEGIIGYNYTITKWVEDIYGVTLV